MDRTELEAAVRAHSWHHAIDLGNGIVTPGRSAPNRRLEATLPDLRGRSVLDIGAWDGYHSFLAERRGAARVVALDHYVWGVDLWARNQYWEGCLADGVLPDTSLDETEFWRPELPGRRGFDLARSALDSHVEPVVADLMRTDPAEIGVFDVVLYLGVLYHIREPLTALERLRRVTGGVAVIETEGIVVPGQEHESLLRFFPGNELAGDFGNWWATSARALLDMCRAAGFRAAEVVVGPPRSPTVGTAARRLTEAVRRRLPVGHQAISRYRLVVHAHR